MASSPTPSLEAIEHSERLRAHIANLIQQHGGTISFAQFMEMALYAPGLGYYSAGNQKFGKNGDFMTAPEISPLFAETISRQCQQILSTIPNGDILELGAGSGRFAADLLIALEKQNALPQHYYILEISADLILKQKNHLKETCPHLVSRIIWLSALPAEPICGIIFANEVLDAMPVHCFEIENNTLKERVVTLQESQFKWGTKPCDTGPLHDALALIQKNIHFEDGYQSEINLMLTSWITTLATCLKEGVILLLDYGYGQAEYYHPDRKQGTLMCFFQHLAHTDPFVNVGLQDITAHVDFTQVAESALDAGLHVKGYTTQSAFLLACGMTELAQTGLNPIEDYKQIQAIKLLTLPSQMGELVKVMALTKHFDQDLMGFQLVDRRRDLG